MRFTSQASAIVALSCVTLLILSESGCGKNPAGGSTSGGAAGPTADEVAPDTLLESSIAIVRTAKFDRTSQQRYQIVSQRLNQFVTRSRRGSEPIITPIPTDLRLVLARRMRPEMLQQVDADQFDMTDMLHLETCYLLRDLVRRITAEARGDLAAAEAIFDWVVRNMQVVATTKLPKYRVVPRVSLILGMGSEEERAWVFIELLRQAGIESVMLGRLDPDLPASLDPYVPWTPAAFVDGQFHIFDTTLGLPVPGPGGQGVATLQQVRADQSLLTALDFGAERAYRFRPEHLKKLVVLYESSPLYNAPRMKNLQGKLSGANRVVLWSDLLGLDSRARDAVGDVVAVDLWPMPATVHQQWQYERGYSEQISQMFAAYSVALLSSTTPTILDARLSQLRGHLGEAISMYLKTRNALPQFVRGDENMVALHGIIRENTAYFLGLTKYDEGDFKTAADWFGNSYLERYSEGRWRSSARYNLGRCSEALKDTPTAIECYTAEDDSPQAIGNLLRARRLGWTGSPKAAPAEATTETPAKSTDGIP